MINPKNKLFTFYYFFLIFINKKDNIMGNVYLIGDKNRFGYYKIGATRGDVKRRLKTLQTGNSGELFIEKIHETKHPFIVENILHNRLTHKRTNNEWYDLELEDVINFAKNCDDIEEIIETMKDNPFFKKKYFKD